MKSNFSITIQWALSSDEIDMAFYCNHIALHLVRSNDNFEIYGPIIINAEILAIDKIENIDLRSNKVLSELKPDFKFESHPVRG